MVISPMFNRKYFSVSCPNCEIDEIITFESQIKAIGKNNININANVPFFYRFEPIDSIDSNGKEIVNIFKPVKGICRDKLPDICPICGTKLLKTKVFVKY